MGVNKWRMKDPEARRERDVAGAGCPDVWAGVRQNARALEDSNARGPKAVRPDGERACRMLANARTMNAMAVKAV